MFFTTPPSHLHLPLLPFLRPGSPSVSPILRPPSIKPLLSQHLGLRNAFSLPSSTHTLLCTHPHPEHLLISEKRRVHLREPMRVHLRSLSLTNPKGASRRFGSNNEIRPERQSTRLITLPPPPSPAPSPILQLVTNLSFNEKSNQSGGGGRNDETLAQSSREIVPKLI